MKKIWRIVKRYWWIIVAVVAAIVLTVLLRRKGRPFAIYLQKAHDLWFENTLDHWDIEGSRRKEIEDIRLNLRNHLSEEKREAMKRIEKEALNLDSLCRWYDAQATEIFGESLVD